MTPGWPGSSQRPPTPSGCMKLADEAGGGTNGNPWFGWLHTTRPGTGEFLHSQPRAWKSAGVRFCCPLFAATALPPSSARPTLGVPGATGALVGPVGESPQATHASVAATTATTSWVRPHSCVTCCNVAGTGSRASHDVLLGMHRASMRRRENQRETVSSAHLTAPPTGPALEV